MSVTSTREQVEAKVYASLVDFGVDEEMVTPEARWADLQVDSLDLVELAQVVEEDFGVQLTGEDIKNLPTVGSVIDLVVTRSAS
jgi:acyl carrier protein